MIVTFLVFLYILKVSILADFRALGAVAVLAILSMIMSMSLLI
jgi:hypothetical protein